MEGPKFSTGIRFAKKTAWKIKSLKSVIKRWVKSFKNRSTQKLGILEEELQSLYQTSLTDLNNEELMGRIKRKKRKD